MRLGLWYFHLGKLRSLRIFLSRDRRSHEKICQLRPRCALVAHYFSAEEVRIDPQIVTRWIWDISFLYSPVPKNG